MRISALVSVAALSLAVAGSPLTIAGGEMSAMAKGGGSGNGGGGGHGGGGNNGRSNEKSDSHVSTNSEKSQGETRGVSSDTVGKSLTKKPERVGAITKQKNVAAGLAGLTSLNRSYKAYMHTSDPRMTAIAAYAIAYARYEIDNGKEPSADDAILGDGALRDALASATKTSGVSTSILNEAKSILGVGAANGKIDQIRTSLETTDTETSAR